MNLGDDRIPVRRLPFDCAVVTEVWLSKSAEKGLSGFVRSNDGQMFAKKLQEMAKSGFEHYEGGTIRSEGQGVLRIGIKKSLFRILGFYGKGGFCREFIAIEAGLKPGQKRGSRIDAKVTEVAKIKQREHWIKVQP